MKSKFFFTRLDWTYQRPQPSLVLCCEARCISPSSWQRMPPPTSQKAIGKCWSSSVLWSDGCKQNSPHPECEQLKLNILCCQFFVWFEVLYSIAILNLKVACKQIKFLDVLGFNPGFWSYILLTFIYLFVRRYTLIGWPWISNFRLSVSNNDYN